MIKNTVKDAPHEGVNDCSMQIYSFLIQTSDKIIYSGYYKLNLLKTIKI